MHSQCLGYQKKKKSDCHDSGEVTPSSRKRTNRYQPRNDPNVETIK